ncbi:uncharacterized protein [Notothenia coriiceps]|uniref:LIM interaction domain-containing protein n=1 Tax=Notothenia coriiceps TaxID=8208 RepID=A0A6I9MZM9_9TELE|nr:PREDICTED: uncharacterized protein LOC104943421 [Notothenia coriiceps]
MNSADSDQIKNAIRSQGQRLGQQEERMATMQQGVQNLTSSQRELQTSVTTQVNLLAAEVQRVLTHLQAVSPPTTPPVPAVTGFDPNRVTEPHSASMRLAPPEKYSGDSEGCRPFIVQCELHYHHQPAAFPTDNSKVAFMISHLSSRAAAWATAEWSRGSPICGSLENFIDTMRKTFDQTTPGREAARALIKLRQHQRSVADYAIEFRTMAADSGWNSAALFDAFVSGLSHSLHDQRVGCTFMALGSRSLTETGFMTLVMGKGPTNRGASFREKYLPSRSPHAPTTPEQSVGRRDRDLPLRGWEQWRLVAINTVKRGQARGRSREDVVCILNPAGHPQNFKTEIFPTNPKKGRAKAEPARQTTTKRRKRKNSASSANSAGTTASKKRSPATNFSLSSQDVMVVGEPTLMGGEFGDEDERLITRLENTQYDATNGLDDEDDFNGSPSLGNNWSSKPSSGQDSKPESTAPQPSQ